MEIVFDSANGIGSNSFVSAEGCQLLFFRSCRLIDRLIVLHTVTRFPGVNSHSCRMLHTNATRTLTFGAKRNGKGACRCARYADRSCRCLPALEPTLVGSMDFRPSLH